MGISEPRGDTPTDTASDPERRTDVEVSLEHIFTILKNERRRHVLRSLATQEEPVSLSDLSEAIAAIENDKPIRQITSQERKRVYVALYQAHLPKMADMGFIEFNKPRGIIELGPAADHAFPYLDDDTAPRYNWPVYYLGLVAGGWVFLAGSLTTPLLPSVVASGVFLTLLTACALTHAYLSRTASDRTSPTSLSPKHR